MFKKSCHSPTIFREYDIRGIVGTELLIDEVYNLGRAIAAFFYKERGAEIKTVAVGMDGRIHSPEIKNELCRALNDSGLDVIFIGVCPSPVLYFALYTLPVDAGLMITASHNPQEYNGLKICLGRNAIWGVQVQDIKRLYQEGARTQADRQGTIQEHAIIDQYVDWMQHHFAHLKHKKMPIVIDCGNGAGGAVMPALIKAMGWSDVQLLYADVDGTYPNHEADPVKEKNMADVKQRLHTTTAQLGVGLDGDADRMGLMTKQGRLIPGDTLLSVFAHQVLQHHPGAAIVMDIKSSAGLLELLQQWGAVSCLSPSGHAIIKDQIKKYNAKLGGELSCHFFFNDRYFGYDDGIYALMRVCELFAAGSFETTLALFPHKWNSPEILIACPEDKKRQVVEFVKQELTQHRDASLITIDGVRATFPYGWGIVRASNTQPMLSLRFESDSKEGLQRTKETFYALLQQQIDPQVLATQLFL